MNNQFEKQSDAQEFIDVISQVASAFALAQTHNCNSAINNTLKIIGDYVDADRSYMFKYDFEKGTTSNTHEYCVKGITKEIDNLQHIPLTKIPDWVKTHKANISMNIHDVSKLDKDDEVSKILEPQFVKSLLTIPLFRNDKLFGFLGFDSVKEKHNYTRFEQTVLTEYSKLLIDLLERLKIDTN